MPAIRYKGVDYTSPTVYVQSDASATDLENTKVPTGQTIKSYLNSNMFKYKDVSIGNFTMPSAKYYNINSFKPSATGYYLMFAIIKDYGQGHGALTIDSSGIYISGDEGAYTNVIIRYVFINANIFKAL